MQLIKETKSLCPECLKVLDAVIFETENKVYIEKECPVHGKVTELYWSDFNQYQRADTFRAEGSGLENPRTESKFGCPFDCGICPEHKSHTGLAIIDITNRCNLTCPVCFANAATAGYVYEPSKEQIFQMLENLRQNKPVTPPALQFSGGEPTIRKDLFELIRKAKELEFHHVEVNTNGLRLANDEKFAKGLVEAGLSTIYLQFDGLTSDVYKFTRGVDLLDAKMRAIDNCREAGLSIVLVVTLVKGVNDHQIGDIIRFAIDNFDIVRCVNVQPVSICGRIAEDEREKMRITIPDFMKKVEQQTEGKIKQSDFYPVPVVVPISRAVAALKEKDYVEFTTHPHCGMATYVFIEGDDMIPINRYGNIDKFIESMKKVYEDAKQGKNKKAKLRLLGTLRHIKFGLLRKYLLPILKSGSYNSLGDLHRKMLLISSMHFMDPYNFDLERLQRCCIHYAIPDGRIIPFCSMNSIHRQKIEEEMGIPLEQWKRQNKKSIDEVT